MFQKSDKQQFRDKHATWNLTWKGFGYHEKSDLKDTDFHQFLLVLQTHSDKNFLKTSTHQTLG